MGPKVTIIIPTFKRSDILPRAVESALNQSYQNIEIIVVDDNDPKSNYRTKTELCMQKYEIKNNVTYIKHLHNKNGSAARNTGIGYSTGKYIAFLDDDDEYMPDKIEKQVQKMESLDESWGACYVSYKKIQSNKFVQESKSNKEGDVLVDALARNLFIAAGSNLLVRKEVIEEIGGFNESFKRNQDIEFLVRILQNYKLAHVNNCLLIVHYEDKKGQKISYEQYIEIDEKYIEEFKPYIESLDVIEKKYIYDIIALQRFKVSITHNRVSDGITNLIANQVSVFKTLKFIGYMANRLITKKSYGFYFD